MTIHRALFVTFSDVLLMQYITALTVLRLYFFSFLLFIWYWQVDELIAYISCYPRIMPWWSLRIYIGDLRLCIIAPWTFFLYYRFYYDFSCTVKIQWFKWHWTKGYSDYWKEPKKCKIYSYNLKKRLICLVTHQWCIKVLNSSSRKVKPHKSRCRGNKGTNTKMYSRFMMMPSNKEVAMDWQFLIIMELSQGCLSTVFSVKFLLIYDIYILGPLLFHPDE